MTPKSPVPPLARSVEATALDWDVVEPPASAPAEPHDALGLSAEDRIALGLSLVRTPEIVPYLHGDATDALAEALARGAAVQPREMGRRKLKR